VSCTFINKYDVNVVTHAVNNDTNTKCVSCLTIFNHCDYFQLGSKTVKIIRSQVCAEETKSMQFVISPGLDAPELLWLYTDKWQLIQSTSWNVFLLDMNVKLLIWFIVGCPANVTASRGYQSG